MRPRTIPECPDLTFWKGRQNHYTQAFAEKKTWDKKDLRSITIGSDTAFPPEFIIRAAVRNPRYDIFSVSAPGRHHDCFRFMDSLSMAGIQNTHDQGFITSTGRYVNRHEACVIAKAAKQIIKKHAPLDELCSEDLW